MELTYLVEVTVEAKQDIDNIVAYYVEQGDIEIAYNILTGLEATIDALELNPERGHPPPEMVGAPNAYLQLIMSYYRVLYKIIECKVFVVAVFDSRRLASRFLHDRLNY